MNDVILVMEQVPAFLYGMVFLMALMIGSFLNVVIYRLPVMMERSWRSQCAECFPETKLTVDDEVFNLLLPRSRCPKCSHLIGATQNIPLISWLIQKGRCKHCQCKISARYPGVELLTGLLSLVAAVFIPFGWPLLFALIFTWALIALSFIDIDTMLLPDQLTLPLLWLGLLINLSSMFTHLNDAVLGAILGYLVLWSIYWLFKLLTGKEGMGYGDFKLLAALGAWFGWQALPVIILLSSLTGAVLGIAQVVLSKDKKSRPIPFGPYLAIAGFIFLLYGNEMTQAYFKMML